MACSSRRTRPGNRIEPRPQPSKQKRRNYDRNADGDRLVQRFKNQLARETGAEESRQHAEGETVELDIVLDRRNGKRPEQQEGEDCKGRSVIHESGKAASYRDAFQAGRALPS